MLKNYHPFLNFIPTPSLPNSNPLGQDKVAKVLARNAPCPFPGRVTAKQRTNPLHEHELGIKYHVNSKCCARFHVCLDGSSESLLQQAFLAVPRALRRYNLHLGWVSQREAHLVVFARQGNNSNFKENDN